MPDQFVIRPVKQEDMKDIMELAKKADPGLTNLLPDEKLIQAKIDWSVLSFEKKPTSPGHELYFFVMEDLETKKVIGTCGIFSDVGDEFYSFKVSREVVHSEHLKIRREHQYLELVNDYQKVSEFALLLLNKHYRKKKLGKFLSRSRYLFMADNLEKFHPHLIAEMRGVVDFLGKSVFWDAVGSRFIEITFTEADYLRATNKKRFISELMPHVPIPVALLPEAAQKSIGAAHPDTSAAVAVLLSEGFEYSRYVDIFDAGPTLEGVVSHIKTITDSLVLPVSNIEPIENGQTAMVGFQEEEYRIGMGATLALEESLTITPELAESLKCKIGDKVRYILI